MFEFKQFVWRTSNLALSDVGTWWGFWRLSPIPYTDPSPDHKKSVRRSHQAFFQALRGESLLLGLNAPDDPAAAVNRMMQEVRMDQCPEYLEEVELTLQALSEVTLSDRSLWLAVPLRPASIQAQVLTKAKASWSRVESALALPPHRPSLIELESSRLAAHRIEVSIPQTFFPQKATPAETTWMHFQAQTRGLGGHSPVSVPDHDAQFEEESAERPTFRSGRELSPALLDEGGQSDVGKIARLAPFRRRYVKVESIQSEVPSYQSMLALVGTPPNGWVFPGVEWLSWLEKLDFNVDWAVRMNIVGADVAKKRNKKAESTLDDQLEQQSGSSGITGSGTQLDQNVKELAAFHRKINADDREVELQATIILAVGAPTPDEVTELARQLRAAYIESEFVFEPILGEQIKLWEAMQPGYPASAIVRELAQLATGSDFSSTVPLIDFQIGDDHGLLFGINQETLSGHPVYLNPYGATRANFSGSVAVVGELGGGKSVTLKKLSGDVVDRYGRICVIDRSAPAEYAKFAKSLVPDQTAIVEILKPQYSLDPIRVFGPNQAPLMTQTLLSSMLRLEAFDEKGAYLGEVLDPKYMAKNKITSLHALMSHLKKKKHELAQELARKMNVIASKPDLSAVLFDPDLPPLPLDMRATVFCTRGLSLPSESELKSETQFKGLGIQKIFGSAIYDLLAEIGRAVCFETDTEFAAFVVDEAHHMTLQPRGHEICMQFVLEGRKSAAAFFIGTQAPSHLGSKELRELIPIRVVHRLKGDLAVEAAELIAGSSTSPELVERIESLSPPDPRDPDRKVPVHRRGEAIIRDAKGRHGQLRVLLPYREERRKAMLTTPPSMAEISDDRSPAPELEAVPA